MRSATPKDSLFNSDQMEAYQDIADKQLAVDMATSGGLGSSGDYTEADCQYAELQLNGRDALNSDLSNDYEQNRL